MGITIGIESEISGAVVGVGVSGVAAGVVDGSRVGEAASPALVVIAAGEVVGAESSAVDVGTGISVGMMIGIESEINGPVVVAASVVVVVVVVVVVDSGPSVEPAALDVIGVVSSDVVVVGVGEAAAPSSADLVVGEAAGLAVAVVDSKSAVVVCNGGRPDSCPPIPPTIDKMLENMPLSCVVGVDEGVMVVGLVEDAEPVVGVASSVGVEVEDAASDVVDLVVVELELESSFDVGDATTPPLLLVGSSDEDESLDEDVVVGKAVGGDAGTVSDVRARPVVVVGVTVLSSVEDEVSSDELDVIRCLLEVVSLSSTGDEVGRDLSDVSVVELVDLESSDIDESEEELGRDVVDLGRGDVDVETAPRIDVMLTVEPSRSTLS